MIGIPRKLRNIKDFICARPNCALHAITASDNSETYFLERLIGRIPREGGARPGEFMWLFKWHECVCHFLFYSYLSLPTFSVLILIGSYDAKDCTWEDSSKIPVSTAERFITEFEAAATAEGFNVNDYEQYIVLEEGALAGWRRAGWS